MIIFMVITLLSNWISKKEAVGYGDVKLISVLGLFFGWRSIIMVSILSFVIAAIVSLVLLLIKKKNVNEYIAFGPFIVISALITIFIPVEELLILLLNLGR